MSTTLPEPFSEPMSATGLRPVPLQSAVSSTAPLMGGFGAEANSAAALAPTTEPWTCAVNPSDAWWNVMLPDKRPPAKAPATFSNDNSSLPRRNVALRSLAASWGSRSARLILSLTWPANFPSKPESNGSLDQLQAAPLAVGSG